MTKKKHWYDFLFKSAEVEAGPVKLKRIPVICLMIVFGVLLTVAYFAFREWMKEPVDVRQHKIHEAKDILK